MTSLGKLTFRTKRAALVGLLLAVPLLPVAGCSGGGGDSGDGEGAEVENGDSEDEDDNGGLY